ncbi:ABC transporter ATP-binding protein [Streptomyces sp. NPDC006784]|uniref:ABC transporter ATP-binding protein n=1 Tax=Streptomyces sp. NPDC006784 TaxID=3364764 RepID=UPI0036BE5EDD
MTITLSGISKTFGDVTAVQPLDLTVPEGTFFALLGASGCGKTTTLRMIAGLEEPTSGSILLGEEDITRLPPHKRPVNTVFQNYALFPHLDVAENIAFGLRRRGVKSVRKQVAEMLDLVQLGDMARRRPRQLSGGQQQRVALARALINRPQVLLLDEPLGALDLKLRRQMQLELKRIQTEVGITFVHVTHDQEEAMTMADGVAVMHGGRVVQLGPPAELYENPRSTFVANFLGTSNLIEAELLSGAAAPADERPAAKAGNGSPDGAGDGAEVRVEVVDTGDPLRLPAARCSAEGLHPGGRVLVGVRPEKISLARTDEAGTVPPEVPDDRNRLTGRIREASYLGVSWQYLVETPTCELTVYEQNVERDSRLAPGAHVVLHWRPAHTFVLDADQDVRAGEEAL